ncbi:MAG: type III-B CRISPR module RAMP protein Cmr1, partial [Thermoplasmata archaeon]
MNEIKATFNIVTPMFISGFDQTKAELRVPSIKGMMRFWWRASNYDSDINILKDKEIKIFGGIDKDIGKSKVSIKLIESECNLSLKNSKDFFDNKKTSYNKTVYENENIYKYVGYGLFQKNNREYIDYGSKFTISLIYENNAYGEDLLNSLKLLGYIGGLGSRWRRGWGSISLVNLTVNNKEYNGLPNNKESFKEQLKAIRNNAIKSINSTIYPSYSALSSQTRMKISKKSFNSWEEALFDISDFYMNYMKGLSLSERKDFGLPKDKGRNDRRASPLLIHVHKIKDNEYYWVCTFLK